jgi:hypothetical protein
MACDVVCYGRRGALETRSALLVLSLIGATVYTANGDGAQPIDPASIQSEPVEVHSVIVDTPRVVSLSHASPETWSTLTSPVQRDEKLPAAGQAAQAGPGFDEIEHLKVSSAANIRSGPSVSAAIVGIAHAGAEVQVASRAFGWTQIIDPWSWRTGWICSKFLTPLPIPSTPAGVILG